MQYLRFATNDDTTMLAIAAGGYGGKSSPYVVNIHFLIGYILKTLYTVIPGINWFTVLYLSLYVSAFIFILYIIAGASGHYRQAIITRLLIVGLSFYLLMSFFSFTVVGYALLSAGMLGITYSVKSMIRNVAETENENEINYIGLISVSTTYFILAAMMRTDVINTAIVMATAYGLITAGLFRERKRVAATLIILIALGTIEIAAMSTNTWLLSRDYAEANFYEWGESRSRALDCVQVPYDAELFSKHDFSKVSYDACYGAFYCIRDAVSKVKMDLLIKWNEHRYNPHVIGFIKSHFTAYVAPGYRRIWQGLFVFNVMAGLILGSKSGRRKMVALYIAVLTADYVYHFIGRPMLHVMMPTYVMGSLLGLVIVTGDVAERCERQHKYNNKVRVLSALAILLAICVVSDICSNPARYSMTLTKDQVESLHIGREYMRSHQNKLFFALDPAVFAVSTDEDMWHNRYAEEPYNLAGNWEIYSVPSDAMFASYGIDHTDPGRELVNNDTAVFLQSENEDTDPNDSYIIDLYKEYYGMSVRFELIDSLKNGWRSYRLIEVS